MLTRWWRCTPRCTGSTRAWIHPSGCRSSQASRPAGRGHCAVLWKAGRAVWEHLQWWRTAIHPPVPATARPPAGRLTDVAAFHPSRRRTSSRSGRGGRSGGGGRDGGSERRGWRQREAGAGAGRGRQACLADPPAGCEPGVPAGLVSGQAAAAGRQGGRGARRGGTHRRAGVGTHSQVRRRQRPRLADGLAEGTLVQLAGQGVEVSVVAPHSQPAAPLRLLSPLTPAASPAAAAGCWSGATHSSCLSACQRQQVQRQLPGRYRGGTKTSSRGCRRVLLRRQMEPELRSMEQAVTRQQQHWCQVPALALWRQQDVLQRRSSGCSRRAGGCASAAGRAGGRPWSTPPCSG